MHRLIAPLVLVATLAGVPLVHAQDKPAGADPELALARDLIEQREQLDRMKLDPTVTKEALLAQERRLMQVRSRLATALAGELARQSTDSEHWRQAWESMKEFLRDRLRQFLDEPEPGTTRT